MELDGAVHTARFVACVPYVPAPLVPVPGHVVALDQVRVHMAPGVAEVLAAFGARQLFLHPYSPGFTPAERACSKLKTGWRTAQARTRVAWREARRTAVGWITEANAKTRFDHCAHHVHGPRICANQPKLRTTGDLKKVCSAGF